MIDNAHSQGSNKVLELLVTVPNHDPGTGTMLQATGSINTQQYNTYYLTYPAMSITTNKDDPVFISVHVYPKSMFTDSGIIQ